MTKNESTPGGLEVIRSTLVVAHLAAGQENTHGEKIGPGYQFRSQQEAKQTAEAASEHTRPVTLDNAAFCIDERILLRLGNIKDPAKLQEIVAPQLPGGTFLAATKASVTANIAAVRGAESFDEAYRKVGGILTPKGFKDAGHEHCGASTCAPDSAHSPLDPEIAFGSLSGLGVADSGERPVVNEFATHLQELSGGGFFDDWSGQQHEKRLNNTYPQNFAALKDEKDATKGHHGSGLLVVTEGGMGFAKNDFVQNTGKQLFAYTRWFALQLADSLGGSPEERRRLELAFDYDLLNVGNQLFAKPEGQPDLPDYYPGMAVLKQ